MGFAEHFGLYVMVVNVMGFSSFRWVSPLKLADLNFKFLVHGFAKLAMQYQQKSFCKILQFFWLENFKVS